MKTIEKMIELQNEFKQLYRTSGLVALSDDYIQLDADFMKEHFPVIRVEKTSDKWFRMTAERDGVTFIAAVYKG